MIHSFGGGETCGQRTDRIEPVFGRDGRLLFAKYCAPLLLDVHRPQLIDEIFGVIGFAGAKRNQLGAIDAWLDHVKLHREGVIRFPADHFGLAIFGHQWKPARLLMVSRSPASAAHLFPMIASSSSIVPTCLLTMGSSTRVHKVSAGCSSGV